MLFSHHNQAIFNFFLLLQNDLQALITAGLKHLFLPTQICQKRNESYVNKTWGLEHVFEN